MRDRVWGHPDDASKSPVFYTEQLKAAWAEKPSPWALLQLFAFFSGFEGGFFL